MNEPIGSSEPARFTAFFAGMLLGAASLLNGCGSVETTGNTAGSTVPTGTGASGGTSGAAGGGTGGSAAGGGGGTAGAGGGGEPIVAPAGEWTWIDFDDARCANGTTTGIGINPGPSNELVLVYLMGGGACWDHQSCYVDERATNISSGFGAAAFAEIQPGLETGPFRRIDLANPFREASYVLVPYCTGDVYAGNAVTSHEGIATHHVGYANIGAYLHRLVPTFPNASRIVLSGSSAGGYGASFNWDRTQRAFGSIRVDMIDDGGPWLPNPYLPEPLEQQFRSAWGTDPNLPPDCTACLEDFSALLDYLATKYPTNRAALLTYAYDPVIASYFGITLDEFHEGLLMLAPSFAAHDELSYFAVGGEGHVMFRAGWGSVTTGGVSLRQWIEQMVTDDPAWGSLP